MIDSHLTLNARIAGVPVQLRALARNDGAAGGLQQYSGHIDNFDIDFRTFFAHLLKDVGLGEVDLPAEFGIHAQLVGLDAVFDTDDKTFAFSCAFKVNGRLLDFFFVSREADSEPGRQYAFGLSIDPNIGFGRLPLVGSFPGVAELEIERVGLVYSNAVAGTVFTIPRFDAKRSTNPSEIAAPSLREGADVAMTETGFSFMASLHDQSSDATESLLLPLDLSKKPAEGTPPKTLHAPALSETAESVLPVPLQPANSGRRSSGAGIRWITLDKNLGPVSIDKIGLSYTGGRADFAVSGSLEMAGFHLGLDGLGVSTDFATLLSDPEAATANPAFDLTGLGLDVRRGSIEIAGGFLRSGGDYLGTATVKTATFMLSAVGGYAPNEESFFIFARLNYPLGGPSFFFVTSLAAGFGINRRLVIPKIDQLQDFPLLPQNNSFPATLGEAADAEGKLNEAMASMAEFTKPAKGHNWIAAGIDFTSFGMAQSSALLTVSLGVETEIALLGITRVTVPTGASEPIAYMELTLSTRFSEVSGLLAIDGRLTPASYLFSGLFRVSGGFAFYNWFAGPNEGDFVISLGGYHREFKKPSHYPAVPRLTFSYIEGPLVIKGTSYFALTPHMLMAGASMNATFDDGSVRAWFSASLDFLLGWKPFQYQAGARIEIGASYTIDLWLTTTTFTIHVGVDLSIWGPPFGGRAVVDLDVISFSVNFGHAQKKEVVSWDDFKIAFLPGPKASAPGAQDVLCSAKVSEGLAIDVQALEPGSPFSWVLDPNHFELTTATVIPSKELRFNEFAVKNPFRKDGDGNPMAHLGLTYHGVGTPKWPRARYDDGRFPDGIAWNDDFGVLPAGIDNDGFQTTHRAVLKRLSAGGDFANPKSYTDIVDDVGLTPLTGNVASAMWGTQEGGLNGTRLIEGTLTGVKLAPIIRCPDLSRAADLWTMLFDQSHNVHWFSSRPRVTKQDVYAARVDPDARTLSYGPDSKPEECADYKLTVLTGGGVDSRRSSVISSLRDLGFDVDPDAVDLETMTCFPLDDWPMVRALGVEVPAS